MSIEVELHSYIDFIKKINKIRKALFIGSGGVGKTSLLNLIEKHQYVDPNIYNRTSFINFGTISISDKIGDIVRIQMYDLAGQINLPIHALKDFSKQTLGATDIIFLVFANNNLNSFLELQKWVDIINDGISSINIYPKLILIKNKTDLIPQIDKSLINEYLKNSIFYGYFEVNCLNGNGLNSLIEFLSKEVI